MKTADEILDIIEADVEVVGKSNITEGNVLDVILYRKDTDKRLMFTFHDNIDNAADIYDYITCLCLDALSIENLTFEDWVELNNYDASDSKIIRTFKKIQSQTERLYRFFSKAELKVLFNEVSNGNY